MRRRGARVGDITHMNGGKFDPHATHGEGTAYDGHFPGYNAMNAATCDAMLKLLFDEVYGDRIEKMFVLYKGHKAFEAQLAKRFGALEAEVKALAGKKTPLAADEKARLDRARALVHRRGALMSIPHHDDHDHITVRPK